MSREKAKLGEKMKILVTNRPTIQQPGVLNNIPAHIIISITAPTSKDTTREATIHTTEKTKGVLRMFFHDVYPMNLPDWKIKEVYGNPLLFNDKYAKEIYDFVKKHEKEVECIIVHCEAGHSRSPGVAAALCSLFKECDENEFYDQSKYRLNMLVYSTLWNYIFHEEKKDELYK